MPRGVNTYDEYYLQGRLDPDAARYISAIERLEGQSLESNVKMAVLDFVTGCKALRIWDAIQACCILAGARTLNGALIPLKGPAPTNFNFVEADYNRRTGLVGDRTTKYLSTNRNNNADPQNSNHNVVWVSEAHSFTTSLGQYLGTGSTSTGRNNLAHQASTPANSFTRNRTGTPYGFTGVALNFFGHSRSSSADFVTRVNGSNVTTAAVSATPENAEVDVFRRSTSNYTDGRLAFYSIGESLGLGNYDRLVTRLMNTLATAIP
jgi:hypothetical protein